MSRTPSPEVEAVLSGRERWAVVEGDALELLAELPAGCASLVLGDPPYGTGAWKRAASGAGSDCRAVHSLEAWDTWEPAWIAEALRVSSGPVEVYLPQTRLSEVQAIAEAHRVPWRQLVWVKPDPRPRFSGQPAFGFEPIMALRVLSGGGMDWCSASAPRLHRDADGTGHPHQKPLEVDLWLVDVAAPAPGSLCVVPFAGSGTEMVAALARGLRVLGFERVPESVATARARCAAAVAGTDWRRPEQPALPGVAV